MRLVRPPLLLKALLPQAIWRMPALERVLYLSFDDGPEPNMTPWVLEQLAKHEAKATFFLIGRNAAEHPRIVAAMRAQGHSIGNHTWDHANGWRTSLMNYMESTTRAQSFTGSRLFRPPYGRITRTQAKAISATHDIVMWDALSYDFDQAMTGEQCARKVIRRARPGSIIVFHDSKKAADRLRVALPAVLDHFADAGYAFRALPEKGIRER
ncbi:MAG: polysaccharide deacetylase family protein [Flavobacteriales bacterium]|nr:polysaccharide deacetylase family protein [Flavobacteriales bacterium]